MPDTMKAAIWAGTDRVEITTRTIPEPAPGQARIKVEAVGVCGTDIAIYKGKHPRAKAPLIMGHEVGGIVDTINGELRADEKEVRDGEAKASSDGPAVEEANSVIDKLDALKPGKPSRKGKKQ